MEKGGEEDVFGGKELGYSWHRRSVVVILYFRITTLIKNPDPPPLEKFLPKTKTLVPPPSYILTPFKLAVK